MARNMLAGCVISLSAILFLSACDKFRGDGEPEAQAVAASDAMRLAPDAAAITLEMSQGNLGTAAELATAATQANPSDPALFLLLARIEAKRQNVGNAVSALQAAFGAGFHDPRGALNHPDFDGIRKERAFLALVQQFSPAKAASKAVAAPAPSSSIRAGDVSIVESADGHSRIRAGDIEIRD